MGRTGKSRTPHNARPAPASTITISSPPSPVRLLTPQEVADLTGMPVSRVWRLLRTGKGPAFVKLESSTYYRVTETALVTWLEKLQQMQSQET